MSPRDVSLLIWLGGVVGRVTIVLGVALWIGRRLRRRNPALGHSVLGLALAGSAMLPIAELAYSGGHSAPGPWIFSLICVWLVGFLVVAVRSLHGFQTLWALRRYGSIPFPRHDLDLDALAERAGYAGHWDLQECATREMAVPITWGVVRPTVMLPADSDRWPRARLEAVVLHELAHVRRRDFLTQAVAELACAALWFNPLAWVAASALRADAETAADDAVLRTGIRPSDYAAELLQIAAELGHRRLPFIYAGTPALRNSKIEARLHAILAPDRRN